MLINPEMRRQAQQLLRNEIDIDLPMIPSEVPDPKELKNFLEAVKPLQYAALARVIEPIVDLVTSTPLTPPDGRMSFEELRSESNACFNSAIVEVSGSAVYQEAAEYPKIISRFDPSRYSRLDALLMGGSGTAANTMLRLLQDLPEIIAHHEPDADLSISELAVIATRSGRLAWRSAMMGSDKMVVLRSVMSLDDWLEKGDIEKAGNPMANYKIIFDEDGKIHSIDFANIEEIVAPKGYRYRDYKPLEKHTALKDVDFHNRGAAGCPVTLLDGSMNQLWQWYVQAVVDNKLWKK